MFNETLNRLLGNGKLVWPKVIAQKLKPPLDLAKSQGARSDSLAHT
jgi:hypothetical protein